MRLLAWICATFAMCAALPAQTHTAAVAPRVGEPLVRSGDEIVVCGQLFHTATPVVLWMDPGGYDAYRVERRYVPFDEAAWRDSPGGNGALSSPNRYGLRTQGLTPEQLEAVRGGGWNPDLLRERVDQFVIHFDACGTSRRCFEVLHDLRGLSVHFMLDIDGTVYQTLDLKERAWHATKANDRSIGIEIANIGAYPPDQPRVLNQWYCPTGDGRYRITLPEAWGAGGVRTEGFVGEPLRGPVLGKIHGEELVQYDLTPQQYAALARLTATLCRLFPKLHCDYPREADGSLIVRQLTDDEWSDYQGLLGHYHVQANKVDPGPAFQWNRLIEEAQGMLDLSR